MSDSKNTAIDQHSMILAIGRSEDLGLVLPELEFKPIACPWTNPAAD